MKGYKAITLTNGTLYVDGEARICELHYAKSGSQNYGAIRYIYKSSTSNATSYSCGGSQTANTYTSSSTNASTSSTMIRFKGNGKTLSYYVGNRTSSTYGLARDTTFDYIIVYNE